MNQELYDQEQKNTADKLRELADMAERGEAVNVLIMATTANTDGIGSRYFYAGPASGMFAHVLLLPRHVNEDERMPLAALFATLLVKMSDKEDELASAMMNNHPELMTFGQAIVDNWQKDGELRAHLEFNPAIAASKAIKDAAEAAEEAEQL